MYENEVLSYNTSINAWVARLADEENEKIKAIESREGEFYTKVNESSDAGVGGTAFAKRSRHPTSTTCGAIV
jgi:hypothetical protein